MSWCYPFSNTILAMPCRCSFASLLMFTASYFFSASVIGWDSFNYLNWIRFGFFFFFCFEVAFWVCLGRWTWAGCWTGASCWILCSADALWYAFSKSVVSLMNYGLLILKVKLLLIILLTSAWNWVGCVYTPPFILF